MCIDCPGSYLPKFQISLISTVCSVLYIAKQGWRVRNEETFQRSSTKALKILPPPQNPNQYSPACNTFRKYSLRSQKFTISGQKSRRFRHKSGLLSFVLSARRSLPTRVRVIVANLLPTPGRLRLFDPEKTAPVWGHREFRI